MEYFQKILDQFLSWGADFLPKLISALLVLLIGWWLSSLISKAILKAMKKGKADAGIVSFLHSVIKNALRVIVVISCLAQLGVNISSIIAALGAAGVTAGLALKDSLSNLASGAILILNRTFHVGDYLSVDNLEGTVVKIEILNTTLTTFDNKEIVIPNSKLTASDIVNYTAQKTRRLDLKYLIDYKDDIDTAKQLLTQLVDSQPCIQKEPAPLIAVAEHQESGVEIVVRVWCGIDDYWPVYFFMQEEVKKLFDKNGVHIPYQQVDVHLVNQGGKENSLAGGKNSEL